MKTPKLHTTCLMAAVSLALCTASSATTIILNTLPLNNFNLFLGDVGTVGNLATANSFTFTTGNLGADTLLSEVALVHTRAH